MKTTVRTDPPVTGQEAANEPNFAAPESLTALAAEGATVDSGGTPGQPDAPKVTAEPVPTAMSVEDVTDLLIAARETITPEAEAAGVMKPGQIAAVWTDSALERIAKPVVRLMNRHGLNMEQAFEKYGDWLMLLAAVAGPAWATFKAIRMNAQERATNAKQQQQPA